MKVVVNVVSVVVVDVDDDVVVVIAVGGGVVVVVAVTVYVCVLSGYGESGTMMILSMLEIGRASCRERV